MHVFQRVINLFIVFLTYLCITTLMTMVVIIFALVISRYLFSYSFVWAEEVVRYMMIWIALLGSAILIQKRDHIRLDFVINLFGPKIQFLIEILISAVELIFLNMLVIKGITWANSMKIMLTPALQISLFWPSLIIPISGILMALFTLLILADDIISLFWGAPNTHDTVSENGQPVL